MNTLDRFFDFDDAHFFVNDFREKPDYMRFEKGIDVELKYIEPLDYFVMCANARKRKVDDEYKMLDKLVAKEYSQKMMNGETFPVPFVDFKNGEQEGRHRAYAVHLLIGRKDVEIGKMPVHIIKKATFSQEEHRNYIVGKFGEMVWNNYYLPEYQ